MLVDTFNPVLDGSALTGDASGNELSGTHSNDQILGLSGHDKLKGLAGSDLLEGDIGHDKLFGGDGKDALRGGIGNDKLFGGNGDDWLFGDEGKDFLQGDNGDDILLGGDDKDVLKGGSGDDLIDGGAGNDIAYLGAGSDVVVLSPDNGYDIVKDFEIGTDKIQLKGLKFDDLEIVSRSRKHTLIRIDNPGSPNDGERLAQLKNVRADQLGIDDFIESHQTPRATNSPNVSDKEYSSTKKDTPTANGSGAPNPVPAPTRTKVSTASQKTTPTTQNETILWAENSFNSDWMDDWDVRSGKSWGFDNLEVISKSQGPFEQVLRVHYPADSASPSVSRRDGVPLGGAQFYADLSLPSQTELRLGYSVRFSDNFDFVKGGKLPGLFGGEGASGGNIPDGTDGFSTRLMWRGEGDGEVYAYLPTSEKYGTSIGRGNWQFQPNVWYELEQEVKLNHPDRANGQVRFWVNGDLVIDQKGLVFRTDDSLEIDGIFFSSFFGGGDSSWATPKDVHIDFADFSVSAAK
ncbi:MAG: hypothetical protein F6K42_21695 [Leptolyngbya sp. SIO1D8]|nr:hypothetical protein [Leptolyngbya sp. SIO1D8]